MTREVIIDRSRVFELPPGCAFEFRVRGTDQIWRVVTIEPDWGADVEYAHERGRTTIELRVIVER